MPSGRKVGGVDEPETTMPVTPVIGAPIKLAITGHTSAPVFEFRITYQECQTFVWSYELTIRNNATCPIHLRWGNLIVENGEAVLSAPTLEHSKDSDHSLWESKSELLEGEKLSLTPAIAFYGQAGEFTDITIPVWILEQDFALIKRLMVQSPIFSVDLDIARRNSIDLATLGNNGKLSLEGIRILLDHLRLEVMPQMSLHKTVLVNFSAIKGMSSDDSILLCLFLIHLGRDAHRKIETFDISPLLPSGVSVIFIAPNHFMTRKNQKSSAPGDTVAAFLQLSEVILSPSAEKLLLAEKLLAADPAPSPEHLAQFVEAAPHVLRAIQAGRPIVDLLAEPASKGENAPNPETQLVIPAIAPKLYAKRPKGQTIVDFLRDPDGWGPYVVAGVLTMPILRKLDWQAYQALNHWKSTKRLLPPDVLVPTGKQAVNQR